MPSAESENGLSETRRLESVSGSPSAAPSTDACRTREGEQEEDNSMRTNASGNSTTQVSQFVNLPGRYSIVAKSTAPINDQQLVEILRKNLPKNSFIVRQQLSVYRNAMFFKISITKGSNNTEQRVVELLTDPKTVGMLGISYGSPLEIVPFKSSYRKEREEQQLAKQVVARNVPTGYTEDYLQHEVMRYDEAVGQQIKSYHRIRTGDDGRPSPSLRVVCVDTAAADSLLLKGLRIEGILFQCERPLQRPRAERCYRCQRSGHRQNTCKQTVRCGKCTQEHDTNSCEVEQNSYKCCNCSGQHAVWYPGCASNRQEVAKKREERAGRDQPQPQREPATHQQQPAPAPLRNAWATQPNSPPPTTTNEQGQPSTPANEICTRITEIKDHLDKRITEMTLRLEQLIGETRKEFFVKLNDAINLTEDRLVATRTEIEKTITRQLDEDMTRLSNDLSAKLATEISKIREDFTSNLRTPTDNAEHDGGLASDDEQQGQLSIRIRTGFSDTDMSSIEETITTARRASERLAQFRRTEKTTPQPSTSSKEPGPAATNDI